MNGHYFIADTHIGASGHDDEMRLVRFVDSLAGNAQSLCIVGDLFEFWFEYRRVIPRAGFRLLSALARLVDSGTRLTCLRGNHDFWLGSFFGQELPDVKVADRLEQTIDGLRVYASHGDELDNNPVPRLFRNLMRNPLNVALYSLLHPDLGIGLATLVARQSRRRTAGLRLRRRLAEFACAKLEGDFDLVVLAHTHWPEQVEHNGGWYINVGDWLRHNTYCVIRSGRAVLERFEG